MRTYIKYVVLIAGCFLLKPLEKLFDQYIYSLVGVGLAVGILAVCLTFVRTVPARAWMRCYARFRRRLRGVVTKPSVA